MRDRRGIGRVIKGEISEKISAIYQKKSNVCFQDFGTSAEGRVGEKK